MVLSGYFRYLVVQLCLTTDLRPNHTAYAQTDKNYLRPCILSRYFSLALRHFKFCDRVFTQSMEFYDGILVPLVPDKYWLENFTKILLSG